MFQMKWVWKNLEGCRKRYVFALCSTVLISMMALVNSVLTAQIMDTVFTPVQQGGSVTPALWSRLVFLVSLLIGFTLFRTSFHYLSIITYETCSQKLLFKLRRELYANMQAQDSSFFSKNRTGDLMTRLTGDLDMVRHTVCYVIRMLIDCVVLFLTTAVTFLAVDWLFALSMLAVTPVIFLLTKAFAKRVHPLYVDLRERLSRLNTAAQENIAGNRVVKAFAREDYEIARFDEKNEDYKQANLKATLLWLKFSPYIDGLSQALSIAVLLVGGTFLIIGRISVGTFALFNSLCWTLTNPMRTLGMLINDLQRFFASASKVIELYYARSTITTRADAVNKAERVAGAVSFDHVDLKLNGAEVLRDITLTGDLDMVRHTVCYVIRMLIDCVVLFLTTAVTFLAVDWLFALSMLAVTPVIFLLTKAFAKRVHPLYVDLRERLSRLNTAAQENIAGNRVVKAFAREDYEIARFDEKNEDYKQANLKATLLWLKFSPYIDGLSQALSIAVLLVGGTFLIIGRISVGTFALFNSLCWTLTNPMRTLGMLINDLQRFFASASKVIELYYARSTITTRADAVNKAERVAGAVSFDHVDLKLNGAEVLRDITLDIKPGETVAIMGPTGSGKTSLVSLIPRFADVSKGRLCVDGVPVGLYDLHKLRSSIGIATQDVFLFSDSVDGNIAYGNPDLSEEDVQRFAKIACVDFAGKLPEGFDTVIGERGTGLSGGQKQRIALARALAVRPSILILDDTTSAVDMETEKYIQEQLSSLDFACTKIIVAQRISTTKRADRIVILDKGRIADIGTHEELIARPGYYREVYELQNGITKEGGAA